MDILDSLQKKLNGPAIQKLVENEATRFNRNKALLEGYQQNIANDIPVKKEDLDAILNDFMTLSTRVRAGFGMPLPRKAQQQLYIFSDTLNNTIARVNESLKEFCILEDGYYKLA